MSNLDAKHFHDEAAAYRFLEAHVWPEGPVCPRCGSGDRIGKLKGKSTRSGVYKCYACRKPFTVKVGTVFESSHIKLHLWLQAAFLMCSSKKGISANQLARTLDVDLKTGWFIGHRLREAMKPGSSSGPLGGEGKIIEADETLMGPGNFEFVNGKGWIRQRGPGGMTKILTLVERAGSARSIAADHLKAPDVRAFIMANASTKSRLMTDEANQYPRIGKEFAKHETVNHSIEEYARGDVTTNTVEGFFSVFKRGMRGTYQHCKAKHLQRYLHEFDFRYSNRVALGVDDVERTSRALRGIVGKRLMYR
jgi:transposase-like protein